MRDMQVKDTNTDIDFTSVKTWKHRKSLGQHVFDTLKRAIIQGDLASGQRLVENRIAEMLDLSRTPVREAMHKLEREGFLEIADSNHRVQIAHGVPSFPTRQVEPVCSVSGACCQELQARTAAPRGS